MKHSVLFLLSVVGGCSGYAALQFVTSQSPSSFIAGVVGRLGMLYGVLLLTTGLYALMVSIKAVRSNGIDAGDSRSLWIAGLPVLVGMMGVLHGYVGLAKYAGSLPAGMEMPHTTVWTTAIVGVFLGLPVFAILLIGRRMRHAPDPLAR